MRIAVLLTLAALSGCGHVRLDEAVTAHNVYRLLLLEADGSFAPFYGSAHVDHAALPDAEYESAMEPYNVVGRALVVGKQAEQALHGALERCQAASDDECDLSRSAFACAADALASISHAYGQVQGGVALYAASAVAETQLRTLAAGAACEGVKQ